MAVRVLLRTDSYSASASASSPSDDEPEVAIDGTTVSPMAIRVVHCESVNTSISGAGPRGLARGDARLKLSDVDPMVDGWIAKAQI